MDDDYDDDASELNANSLKFFQATFVCNRLNATEFCDIRQI